MIGVRKEYTLAELNEGDLRADPTSLLRTWMNEAALAGNSEPSAMCLSTVSLAGAPSSRIVLLRAADAHGLVFFSNYESRKGQELAQNPHACLCFWWPETQRQVRVEGTISPVASQESDAYFASRPYESRLASAASPQSQIIPSREVLDAMVDALRAEHPDQVPRPANWGGYRLVAHRFEFWQGRQARLHDRFEFDLAEDGRWHIGRLAP